MKVGSGSIMLRGCVSAGCGRLVKAEVKMNAEKNKDSWKDSLILSLQPEFSFCFFKLKVNFLKLSVDYKHLYFASFPLGTLITLGTIYQRLIRLSGPLPMLMYACSCLPITALRLPALPFSITSTLSAVQVPWSLFCTLWSLHSQVPSTLPGPGSPTVQCWRNTVFIKKAIFCTLWFLYILLNSF